MSARGRGSAVALIMLVAVFTLWAGRPLLVPLVLIALAVGLLLVPIAHRRPERAALLLAVIAVAGGVAAGVRVADGIADSRVEYQGKLDVHEILRTFHPRGPAGSDDPLPAIKRMGHGYVSSAQADMTVPRAEADLVALWAIQELAPWLLAAIVLALLVPILRAAERGDPFWEGATRRLTGIGTLLLVGFPAIALLQYVVAEIASAERGFAAPSAEPTLTISIGHILPGLLVLVLARIFSKGVELRELDRHTI